MSYGTDRPRLLSKPVPVLWLGWETDTYRLQQAGWELSVDQCVEQMAMRMVVRHQQAGFIGQTNNIPMQLARDPYYDEAPKHIWQMSNLGREIRVHSHGGPAINGYLNFQAVDAKPQLSFEEVRSLEDMVPFAGAPIVQSRALILPEASVDDLLAGILERQHDAKMAYFEDLVPKVGELARPPAKFHAQIISLDDYRRAA